MVKAGDTIHNPLTGETFTFLQTAADTGGQLLQMEARIQAGRGLHVPPHVHPFQAMQFSIKQGKMKMLLAKDERVYSAGDTIHVPVGTFYNWSNVAEDDLVFVVEYRPAGEWEKIFESTCALGRDQTVLSV